MKTQMMKWGNSLAVRIPKSVAEAVRAKEGDWLELKAREECIELHKITRMPSLVKLVAEITPENRYEEIPSRSATRKEEIEW